jgi:antitoxin component of RelBE/YafQ-DinJ toxin-antitoxin module
MATTKKKREGRIDIRLDPVQKKRFKAECQKQGLRISDAIRVMITKFLGGEKEAA